MYIYAIIMRLIINSQQNVQYVVKSVFQHMSSVFPDLHVKGEKVQ